MKGIWLGSLFFLLQFFAFAKDHEVFYLGFHAHEKHEIIKGFLSEEGKVYPLGNGSVFVKDRPEVLKTIRDFIHNQASALAQGLTIRLKEKTSSSQQAQSLRGAFQTSPTRAQIELGERSTKAKSKSVITINTLSGSSAKISDISRSTLLSSYRNRFMDVLLQDVGQDGFEFEVLPILSGQTVKVTVKRSYYTTVKGKRRVFRESTVQSTHRVPLGSWHQLGGSSSTSQSNSSSITGLTFGRSEVNDDLNMQIRVDLQGSSQTTP